MTNDKTVTSDTSKIWSNHITVPDTPAGFTVRTTFPANPDGAEVMLERWEAGSEEPPPSHPGDDMTVVVEGKMSVQFYNRKDGKLGQGLEVRKRKTAELHAFEHPAEHQISVVDRLHLH